jgi:cysteine dioxygenase
MGGACTPDDGLITLDRLILELGREPASSLTHERLMSLAERLDLADDLIAARTRFARDEYARNLVCRTPDFELLVLCWRPGQESTVHDHAGALNAIRVHRGVLTSRLFERADGAAVGTGPVRRTAEEAVPAGRLTGLDRGGVHQLANTARDDLVTVHIYAPPLMELTVYSAETDRVERRPLRYTLEQDLL